MGEEDWTMIRCETVGQAGKWRLLRSETRLGFRGTEYGVPGGKKIELMGGMKFPIRSMKTLDWAFGYSTPGQTEMTEMEQEWGQIGQMLRPWTPIQRGGRHCDVGAVADIEGARAESSLGCR